MVTDPPEPPPPASAAPALPKDAAARPSRAAALKAGAEAASAVLKTLLLVLAVATVGVVLAKAVWRDQSTRHLAIDIDAETARSLRALGADVDLRQLFVDALNERVHGVQQIVELNFAQLIDTRQSASVSFEPFGLKATSGQLTELAREVTGAPPPLAARVDVMCAPAPCAAGAGEATLLVTLSGPHGGVRQSFPLLTGGLGLRRSLRAAMERAAELLLEREEPMIASVYFLNVSQRRAFEDDKRRDLERAAGAALKLRDDKGDAHCVANLVMGASLFQRGSVVDGLALQQRAMESRDTVCRIHGATNTVGLLWPFMICLPDAAVRTQALQMARQAQDSLRSLAGGGPVAAERIPAAEMAMQLTERLLRPEHEPVRQAWCTGQRPASPTDAAAVLRDVKQLLDLLAEKLPPKPSPAARAHAREMLQGIALLADLGVPYDDVKRRYLVARLITLRLDGYLSGDSQPRALYLLRGQLSMRMARAAQDALFLPPPERPAAAEATGADPQAATGAADAVLQGAMVGALASARVDFENALAAAPSAQVSDTHFDVRVLSQLGDALFVAGEGLAAIDAYTRAIDSFMAADAPVDQIAALAGAVARRSVLLVAGRTCSVEEAEAVQGAAPVRTAASPSALCAVNPVQGAALWPAVLKAIRPLTAQALAACTALKLPAEVPTQPQASTARQAHAVLDCLRNGGPDDPRQLAAFRGRPSRGVHESFERALVAAR